LVRDAADALPVPLAAVPVVAPPAAGVPPGPRLPEPALLDSAKSPALPLVEDGANLPASRYLARRERANKLQLTLAVLMLAVVIVLAGVLIWVLRRGVVPAETKLQVAPIQLARSPARTYVAYVHVGHTSLTSPSRFTCLERLTYTSAL
jgi:hypothetical protein